MLTERFRNSLQHMPDVTKRRTVLLRRLEAERTIWRASAWADYRMLFRLTDDEFRILDIVHRQGLERAVRELT